MSDRRSTSGFSLLELVVAIAVAGVVLAAGWSWCWSSTRACARGDDRIEASSSIAFVRRLTAAETRAAVCLVNAPDVACGAHSLTFAVPAADGRTLVLVSYAWDARRSVLWRKASGSHLTEGARAFSVTYFDAQGRPLPCPQTGYLAAADLAAVRQVGYRLAVAVGEQVVAAEWRVCLRGRS